MTRRSVLSFAIGACGESCCAIDVGKALFSKCGLWPLAWRRSRGRSTQLLTNLKNTQQCTQKIPNPHRVRQSQPSCFLGVLFGRATRNWQHDAFRYNRRTLHTVSKDDSAALSGKAESVQSRKLSATGIAKNGRRKKPPPRGWPPKMWVGAPPPRFIERFSWCVCVCISWYVCPAAAIGSHSSPDASRAIARPPRGLTGHVADCAYCAIGLSPYVIAGLSAVPGAWGGCS